MHQKTLFPARIIIAIILLITVASLANSQPAAYSQEVERAPLLPDTLFQYANLQLPPYFNQPNIANADNQPANNQVSDAGATLGRVLFYDPLLSANNSISCSSCHIQANGFSDPATLSEGFDGGLTGRHSMSLANARYYENGRFFWDERAATLEEQVLLPIQDSVEMGLTLAELETKLAATSYYSQLFDDAFGSTEITSDRVSLALAQFVRSMVSYQSKFDEGIPQGFANFTDEEDLGRQIFTDPQRAGCGSCHSAELQIADEAHNNGLDATTTDEGAGNGRFKVPSLRNIELTAPYMHDGRLATLEDVVTHYNSGVQAHPALARQLRLPGPGPVRPRRLNLDQAEQNALMAFMKTLTDDTFSTAERFADPFVEVTPTATSVPSDTATPTATPLPMDTVVPTDAATAMPTNTVAPNDTVTPLPTNTVAPNDTATPMPTITVAPNDTVTPLPTNTVVSNNTVTLTPTNTVAPNDTSTPMLTNTVVSNNTVTLTPTNEVVPNDTVTSTPANTAVPTDTATVRPTNTAAPADTAIPTPTLRLTPTLTPTRAAENGNMSPTREPAPTPASDLSPTATSTGLPTTMPTMVPTATATPEDASLLDPNSSNQNSNSSGGGVQQQSIYLPFVQE